MLYTDDLQLNSYAPVPSLLSEQVIQSIWGFVHCLETIATDLQLESLVPESLKFQTLEPWILEAIRQVSQTEQVLHAHYDPEVETWKILHKSWGCTGTKDDRWVLKVLDKDIPMPFWSNQILKDSPQGIYKVLRSSPTQSSPTQSSQGYTAYSIIPLFDAYSCLLIRGLPVQRNILGEFHSPFLNDQFTYLVTSFYKNSLNLYKPKRGEIEYQIEMIEARILDDLKSRYGFVPRLLYDRRFELFQTSLARTKMHFEPILDLETMTLHGWEALARDPFTQKAPVDLFAAAELWGLQFTVTLDTTLLVNAVQTFDQRLKSKRNRLFPLFVNVYPESLMMPEYFEKVKQLTQENLSLIEPHYLTLEISEKKNLPFNLQDPYDTISLETFKQRLTEYMEQLGFVDVEIPILQT
ncbi:MAG: EAL domain-containing protein, partial [Prochlorotrichaceae cyanobacterium]